jgi:tRNA pseudouridine55 synthase
MDGLLVVDKPAGPTSHDVVARMRRALREKRIGHTGTLDPMATGVLLLVIGKATRLAKFLTASDKSYEAIVRFGFATDTADAQGRPLGAVSDRGMPSRKAIDAALDAFRGTFLQQPPAFSAKKIDGQRSYALARARAAGHLQRTPDPCLVTSYAVSISSVDDDRVTLSVECSAGFYIRSLAHDLGERLGVGAHLTALRRTRSGDFDVSRALDLATCERDPERAAAALVPPTRMLPSFPSALLTDEGAERVRHGRDIGPGGFTERSTVSPQPSTSGLQHTGFGCDSPVRTGEPYVRLLDRRGELIAIAQPTGLNGVLHPLVVLV